MTSSTKDVVESTGLGCLQLNDAWERFAHEGALSSLADDPVNMGMLLRRRLMMLHLFRLLPSIASSKGAGESVKIVALGAGRDDQFDRLSLNPKLDIVCVDRPAVVALHRSKSQSAVSRVLWRALDIVVELDEVRALILDSDVVVAEGVFIYLENHVVNAILQCVEESASYCLFNVETNALKSFLPLMKTGFEDVQFGSLVSESCLDVTDLARCCAFGTKQDNVKVMLCLCRSSKRTK